MISQFTDRQLNITSKEKGKAAEKLSTGYKINRSADDAAGLSISEKMRWQIRGLDKASDNVQDGVSLLQVADGALNEVHGILQRMRELAVQAANDSNTTEDRYAIQQEMNALGVEIDRIGEETEFNTQKIFKGGYTPMLDPNGNPIPISQIPVQNFQISRADLNYFPFTSSSSSNYLNLSVATTGGYTQSHWNLLYSSGNTSHSAVRVTYLDNSGNTVVKDCSLDDMQVGSSVISPDGSNCQRSLSYDFGDDVQIEISQIVNVGQHDGTKQDYELTYDVSNNGTRQARIEFMFNADTAYNNDDFCEEYYIGGTKVDNFCMYTNNSDFKNQNQQYVQDISQFNGNAFSIIDSDDALPFSERISWVTQPDTVLIGNWRDGTGDWGYYDQLDSKLGGNTNNQDIAFSMIWDSGTMQTGSMGPIRFNYGIVSAAADSNLQGVNITYSNSTQVHINQMDLWIQSGARNESGQFITIDEMNTSELGIKNLRVSSFTSAGRTISSLDRAIDKISGSRSLIGAQQNRLEYTKLIDDNTSENTQAAESRLRDTDMAEEMVGYTKHSILEQAGQAMLAQANQSQQGILTLLQ